MRSASNRGFVGSVFSFFSGAGFLDLGFEKKGFQIALANEYFPDFARAYKHAREAMGFAEPHYGIDVGSAEDWLLPAGAAKLRSWVKEQRTLHGNVGFVGGPPCPDFSVAGKNRGRGGANGRLTESYFRLIADQKPDWFLFENVKGLLRTTAHRAFLDEMLALAIANGYSVSLRVVNSLEYGVPQDRERVIVIGLSTRLAKSAGLPTRRRLEDSDIPWTTAHRYSMNRIKSVKWPDRAPFGADLREPSSIIRELTVTHWFEKNAVEEHPNAEHRFMVRSGWKRFLAVDEGDVSRKSYKRLHRWRYSPTAAYGNNEVHLHPTEPRRLSVAEALAIQSLPAGFAISPELSQSAMFKTVGNGVPYLVARGLASLVTELTG